MSEVIRLRMNPRRTIQGEMQASLLVAASYVPFMKPLCKLDSSVNFRTAQGVQG